LKYAPFPLVEIGGRPYERGVAYGRAAVERIGRSVRLYAGQMSGTRSVEWKSRLRVLS
jgi:isopenicillin-N N-acyltransferase like protein